MSGGFGNVVVDGNVTLPALATVDGRDVSVDGAVLDSLAGSIPVSGVVEVDFGTTPIGSKIFTVPIVGMTAASKVVVMRSGLAATGKTADENEFDAFEIYTTPGVGAFTMRMLSLSGFVAGAYKVQYIVLL